MIFALVMLSPWMQQETAMNHHTPRLLTADEAADQLRKTPAAFREAMCRSHADWAIWLSARRIKLGRRYYLHQEDVEAVLRLGDAVAQSPAVEHASHLRRIDG